MRPGRLQPSAVEPLSRQAWERVETRLFERLSRGEHQPSPNVSVRSPAPVRVWLGAAALALTGTVLLWLVLDTLHHGSEAVAPVVAPLAAPVVSRPLEPLAPAAPLRSDSEITRIVTSSAETHTTLGEAALTLSANSDVRVRGSDERGWLVELERGEVQCEVAPRHGRPAFVVQAGETRVRVVGTRFSVAREGDGATVSVREGQVQVESGKAQVLLGPGERWPPAGTQPKARASKQSPESARARFERAARLEPSQPEKALRLYADLVKTRGPWAANALYAQARLESERGNRERARALLQRYLARYPKGVNAPDVRALLERP